MDFGGGDNTFDITTVAGNLRPSLSWAEPRFGVTTDFDIYVLNGGALSPAGCATPPMNCGADEDNLASQDPSEFMAFTSGGGARQIVVRRYAGAGTPRLKFVFNDNGANTVTATQALAGTDVQGPTIYGHNGTANAQTVAAVPFNNSSVVEDFSSRGPVTYLFGPVTSTTPAAPLPSPFSPPKPDVAATDKGANTFFGSFSLGAFRFSGTSAAAPHAAAVGALQLETNPTLTQAQVKAAQKNTAINLAAPPTADGSGLIDAVGAISSAPPPAPAITIVSPTEPTNDNTPAVEFSIFPVDPKVLTCSVDGGAPQPCASPFTTGSLSDGDHTLRIDATDYFNAAGSTTGTITVDTKKPKLKVKGPKKQTTKTKAKFKIKTEAGAELTCKLDKAKAKACSKKPKFNVDEGKHKLKVEATDAAGNVAKTTYKWKVL
jgi:hypothetical protein